MLWGDWFLFQNWIRKVLFEEATAPEASVARMADLLAGYSANYDEVPPHSREGEEEEEEDEEVFNSRMQESMALNAQLKAMLAQAEASEQQRLQQPQMRLPMGARQAKPQRTSAGLLVPRPKNGGWGGSTHSEARAAEITRANQILVSKLGAIATERRRPLVDGPPVLRQNPAKSTVAINRRHKNDQIARENAAMARRLTSVKASKGISVKDVTKHAREHERHLAVLRNPAPQQMLLAAVAPVRRLASRTGRPATHAQGIPNARPFEF